MFDVVLLTWPLLDKNVFVFHKYVSLSYQAKCPMIPPRGLSPDSYQGTKALPIGMLATKEKLGDRNKVRNNENPGVSFLSPSCPMLFLKPNLLKC